MQKWMMACIVMMIGASGANAQRDSYKERATAYVEKHKMFAMAEQQRTGVPAAVTLGQGILETEAGNSELATQANNHFGIKCKSTWTGPTFAHTDDAPNECFRKYGSTYDSYKDHSDFLKQPRYSPLFRLPVADYEGWAKGLKKYGYATNPRYAQQLIKIIEDFNLQDYTFAANNKDIIYPTEVVPDIDAKPATGIASAPAVKKDTKPVAANTKTVKKVNGKGTAVKPVVPATPTPPPAVVTAEVATPENMKTVKEVVEAKEAIPAGVEPGKIIRINGLRAIYGLRGDVLLTYAIKHNVRYERLLEINEVPDAPLKENMYVFLDKKKTRGSKPTHMVGNNESLMQVAQAEGIQITALRELNRLDEGDEPVAGAILALQRQAPDKPQIVAKANTMPPPAEKGNRREAKKSTYIEKSTLEKDKKEDKLSYKARKEEETKAAALKALLDEEQKIAALKAQREEEQKAIALKAQQEEEEQKAAALKAQQEEEEKVAALKAQQEEAERELARLKAEKEAADLRAAEEEKAKQNNRVVIKNDEPQDEFSRLKSQLDKVVYAGDEHKEEETKKAEEKKLEAARIEDEKRKAAAAKAAEQSKYYVVKKGDTVASIARKNKLTMRQLMEWNNMDWAEVTPGQKLVVKQ